MDKGNELAKLINNYTGIAIQYMITRDKKYLSELDIAHSKIKEFISGKHEPM